MRLAYIVISSLLLIPLSFFGQTVTSVNDPIVYNGSCTNFQNNSGNSQPTAIWIDQNLILNNIGTPTTIVKDFEIYMGEVGEASQGLAVVLQQSGNLAIGTGGEGMGYGGITSSIAFEIDTHIGVQDSLAAGNHHLGVHLDGQYELPSASGGPVILPNMFDGNYHHGILTINWDPDNASNQSVSFSIDGTYTLTFVVDLSTIFNLSSPIFIGGTSAPHDGDNNPVLASQGAPGSAGACSSLSLPIELLSFESEVIGQGKVRLDWETANEQNFSHFAIERSQDQQLWQVSGRVDGSGNSEQIQTYSFVDRINSSGKYYYRLKEVDMDGTYSYSKILQVELNDVPVRIYPNPAEGILKLDLGRLSSDYGSVELEIMDIQGKTVYREQVKSDHIGNKQIDISALYSGFYLLKINGKFRTIWTGRLMVK